MSLNDPIDRDDLAAIRDLLDEARPTTAAEAFAQIQALKIALRRILRALVSGRIA